MRAKATGQRGVIVEAEYEGPPPGVTGAYDIIYQVQTDDGLFFNAQQIDLERLER